jgi:hypothetical protein
VVRITRLPNALVSSRNHSPFILTFPLFCLQAHVRIKVKLSLCFNRAPRHEGVLGEWSYISTNFLASALDAGEWSASRPGRFIPRKRGPGTHCIGGWVGPRAGLDAVVQTEIRSPYRDSNLSPNQPVASAVPLSYPGSAYVGMTL